MTAKEQQSTLKDYASRYGISVLDAKGEFKTINQLSIDIYKYEVENAKTLKDTYYPFLRIK